MLGFAPHEAQLPLINGVYEAVLEEILQVQSELPERILFL